MGTTSQITPGKDKDVSKGTGGESPSLLDAKVVGGNGANGVGGNLSTQVDGRVIDTLAGQILDILTGLSCNEVERVLKVVEVTLPANSYVQSASDGTLNPRISS